LPAEQDALRFPLLWTHRKEYDPGREDKDFFLWRAFSRKAKDAQDKGEGDMINRTWLDQGWDSDAHS